MEITVGGEKLTLRSPERLPANLLQAAGIRLFPGDLLTQNGQTLDPNQALPIGAEASLRFLPAREIILEMDGQTRTIYTQQDRLADALLEAGIHLQPEDRLSAEPDTLLGAQNTFSLDLARSLTVTVGKETLVGLSAARTVGEALADLGLAPNTSTAPFLPRTIRCPDGQITFIQGSESISMVKDETPFSYTYQLDPETGELDTTTIIAAGQLGLVVTPAQQRENGEIIQTLEEGPWKASDPPWHYGQRHQSGHQDRSRGWADA